MSGWAGAEWRGVVLSGAWRREVAWPWVRCGCVTRAGWRGASGAGGMAWWDDAGAMA